MGNNLMDGHIACLKALQLGFKSSLKAMVADTLEREVITWLHFCTRILWHTFAPKAG